jgi:hypothetical protein
MCAVAVRVTACHKGCDPPLSPPPPPAPLIILISCLQPQPPGLAPRTSREKSDSVGLLTTLATQLCEPAHFEAIASLRHRIHFLNLSSVFDEVAKREVRWGGGAVGRWGGGAVGRWGVGGCAHGPVPPPPHTHTGPNVCMWSSFAHQVLLQRRWSLERRAWCGAVMLAAALRVGGGGGARAPPAVPPSVTPSQPT